MDKIKVFDADIRYKNLLIGISRQIEAAEEKARREREAGTGRSHKYHHHSNNLRKLLACNRRACRFYFGTCESAKLAALEIENDGIE